MRTKIALGMFVALLASCVTTGGLETWEKQGATESEFNQDAAQCKAQGLASSAPMVLGNSVYASCMQGKGWRAKDSKA